MHARQQPLIAPEWRAWCYEQHQKNEGPSATLSLDIPTQCLYQPGTDGLWPLPH